MGVHKNKEAASLFYSTFESRLNTRTGSCAFTADEKNIKDRRNKTLPVVDNKRGITKGIKGLTTLYIMLKPTFLVLFYPLLSPITHFYFCFLSTSPFLERPWSFSFLIFAIFPPFCPR